MRDAPPLLDLVQRLRKKGVSISTRDYLDALVAIRAGYGIGTRAALRGLCEALWARSEAEARSIRLVFDEISAPDQETLDEFGGMPPSGPEMHYEHPQTSAAHESFDTPDQASKSMPVDFGTSNAAGVDIPRAHADLSTRETFVLHDQSTVSERSFVVSLRRFRRALRSGPKVELDIHATIDAKSKLGMVAAPVLAPARRNQARLVVLFDVSRHLLPWSSTRSALMEALDQSLLARTATYFFENSPSRLYADKARLTPIDPAVALRKDPNSALLIFSDAGAVRGRTGEPSVEGVRTFVKRVSEQWSPCAWLNPMPRSRWRGTSAQGIAALGGVMMSELTEDGVVQVVDRLRGYGG